MNSKQAAQFQSRFNALLQETQTGTFVFQGLIEDDDNVSAMLLGNVEDDAPQRASLLVSLAMENLFSVLAKYNGLPPHMAAGALHSMVDHALDEIMEAPPPQRSEPALA